MSPVIEPTRERAMGLFEQFRDQFENTVASDPGVLEMNVHGKEAGPWEVVGLHARLIEDLRTTVLTLAKEVDRLKESH